MKRTTRMASRIWAALLVVLMLAGLFTASATQNIDTNTIRRFNVMLVIDGSGSLLVKDGHGTDPDGKRYDAIDLFLALLTDKGNEVGAIVFNESLDLLNVAPSPLDGKAAKVALSESIRAAAPNPKGDTDIGGALLAAVNHLTAKHQQNGLDSVVILFSDGNPDFSDTLRGDEKAQAARLEQSQKDLDQAIAIAQDIDKKNGASIPIYTVCLNINNNADPTLLADIAQSTSGESKEINDAQDLSSVFEDFYKLIFSAAPGAGNQIDFSKGRQTIPFSVPAFGAEEVNIILTTEGVSNIGLKSPTGDWSPVQIEDASMKGGEYKVIKLVDPDNGTWALDLSGDANASVTVNLIYNVDSTVVISTTDGSNNYALNAAPRIEATFYRENNPITDPTLTNEYSGVLQLKNLKTGTVEELPMVPDGSGKFYCDLAAKNEASYEAVAVFRAEDLNLHSNTFKLGFGNAAPTLTDKAPAEDAVQKVLVTPFSGRHKDYELSEFFTDDETEGLHYTVANSQLREGTVTIEGSKLRVETASSHSGTLVIRGTDDYGDYCDLNMRFKVTNLSVPMIIVFCLIVAAVAVIAGYFLWWLPNHKLFRGTVAVSQINDTGMPRTHAAFRGKLKLTYFAVYIEGMDLPNAYLKADDSNRVSFHSKKPVYNQMGEEKTEIQIIGTTRIYRDREKTDGIKIAARNR